MGRRVGAAADQGPLAARLGGRDVVARREIDPAGRRAAFIGGDGDDAGVRGREAALGEMRVHRADDGRALGDGRVDQGAEQPVGRSAEAQIDHLGSMVDREAEGHREAQAVAQGIRRAGVLPAGAQGHQPRARSDADHAFVVVAYGGDDAGDAGAVALGLAGTVGQEIAADLDLADEVGMAQIDAAVDHRDLHVAAGGDLMQVGDPPGPRRRLQAVERIVRDRRFALSAVDVHGLRPGDAGFMGQAGRHLVGRASDRRLHDVAIHAQHRHGPAGDQGQAVGLGQARGDPAAGRLTGAGAIAAAIGGVGLEVGWRQAQHDQNPCPLGILGVDRQERDGRQEQTQQQAAEHGDHGAGSIGSAMTMSRRPRRPARAASRSAAGTARI